MWSTLKVTTALSLVKAGLFLVEHLQMFSNLILNNLSFDKGWSSLGILTFHWETATIESMLHSTQPLGSHANHCPEELT